MAGGRRRGHWLVGLAVIVGACWVVFRAPELPPVDRTPTVEADTVEPTEGAGERQERVRVARDAAEVVNVAPDDDEEPWPVVWTAPRRITVFDRASGVPLSGVRLSSRHARSAETRSAVTDATGVAELPLPDEEWLIWGVLEGYETWSSERFAHFGEVPTEIEMEPGRPLRVRVVGPDGRTPVRGARVFAWDRSSKREIHFDRAPGRHDRDPIGMRASSDGVVVIPGVENPSSLEIVAEAPGLAAVSRAGPRSTDETEVVVSLRSGRTIEGIVRDRDGRPVAGAAVVFLEFPAEERRGRFQRHEGLPLGPAGGPWIGVAGASTDAHGRFGIDGLPGTSYDLLVRVDGVAQAIGHWESSADGGSPPVELVVAPVSEPVVRCVSPSGARVPLERVRAVPLDPVDGDDRLFLDVDAWHWPSGSAVSQLSRRRAGTYRLDVVARSPWIVESQVVELREGRTLVDVVSTSGLTLTGVVRDQRGVGVPEAKLSVANGEIVRTAETDADGHFRVEGLDAGALVVTVDGEDRRFMPEQREHKLDLGTDANLVLPVLTYPRAVCRIDMAQVHEHSLRVGITTRNGRSRASARIDTRDGTLSFLVPAPGTRFDLWIHLGGGKAPIVRRGLVSPSGPSFDLGEVVVAPAVPLRVRIVDEAGEAISTSRVQLADQLSSSPSKRDEDGWYEFATPPALPVRVHVAADGYADGVYVVETSSAEIVPERGSEVEVQLSVEPRHERRGVGLYFIPDDVDQAATANWLYGGSAGSYHVRLRPGRYEIHRALRWNRFTLSSTVAQLDSHSTPLARFEVPTSQPVRVRIE